MARKVTINAFTHPDLAKRFREVVKTYNNRIGTNPVRLSDCSGRSG